MSQSTYIPYSISQFYKQYNTSSSRSSKYFNHSRGTTSLNPSRNALVCDSTPLVNLQLVINLNKTLMHSLFNLVGNSSNQRYRLVISYLHEAVQELPPLKGAMSNFVQSNQIIQFRVISSLYLQDIMVRQLPIPER